MINVLDEDFEDAENNSDMAAIIHFMVHVKILLKMKMIEYKKRVCEKSLNSGLEYTCIYL